MEPVTSGHVAFGLMKAAIPKTFDLYKKDQAEKAHQEIERQLRKGKYWAIADDKAAAAIWRYMRAAIEGSARRNLALLAEALVTGAADPEFAPDEFKRQADRLDGLTRTEVLVLAAFIKTRHLKVQRERAAEVEHYNAAVQEIIAFGLAQDEDEADGVIASLVRTGWIAPSVGFSFFGYTSTPALDEVARLVDFAAAAEREFSGEDLR